MNKVKVLDHYEPSQHALQLHSDLTIADLHADNLLWDRDLTSATTHGMVDLPKLISGNYTLQVFDAVIKSPRTMRTIYCGTETSPQRLRTAWSTFLN